VLSEALSGLLFDRWPYLLTVVLLLIGLYGMLMKRNLVKKLIGMNIFQSAIILFFIVHAYKHGASVPVYSAVLGDVPEAYMNPIPHGLMLTAIVVSVATTGVALALLTVIYRRFGSIDEGELLRKLRDTE
jgi:multicomponent Na+:H+ antiporter subunit C